ncbi:tissue factor pathway inhibitor [Canis lupus familiaris]|uniref:Tissue factor pathway inhibitor n=2 Tax=Canis lupus familiaris TaxID=9615 RepID=Q28874_CANLF|nr:tissue factor pathway inhibitor [Canis lupus familiaris]XP_038302626.1 tissue factor pathway inhibitor isoform X1 [Canis lupus familiaris]XP_038302627.1 tissue factor pathway inhibitor isoform X1 [Canis lupus familiaris]XP_038302628.1 tissue factor pathway inhibitor isoform X1 [Canis lupus familiaris]XP_038302629.1 tissue factor pathway inhibitor isoform X1 [Canis lupus familiaris]pir/S53325/ tissue factor pathway inhibitor - rabbit [Oryctolagus cuniculus]AAB32443.1 tissue factor pathway i|eukprot:NP_001003243.1 tissue factor pathway inhibitor [Canis lupus familiaris]
MIYTMKKEQIFWVSTYLLLNCASAPLNAVLDESEEYPGITDELPPLRLLHSFCALKADNGPCRAMIRNYFFNIHTQQCEEFIYGGCEGNQNRFESLEECEEKCVRVYPKAKTETLEKVLEKPDYCHMNEDSGLCRGFVTRYYYNNVSSKCEGFKYGGCLGNLNNFETLEQCKNTCEGSIDLLMDETVNNTGSPGSMNNTSLFNSGDSLLPADSGDSMPPDSEIGGLQHDSESGGLQHDSESGGLQHDSESGGLQHDSESGGLQHDSESGGLQHDSGDNTSPPVSVNNDSFTPRPPTVSSFLEFYGPSWCLTPADRGLCHANESRFYYNSVIGKCRPFKYSGCGGNENNFTSKKACLTACKKGFMQRISKGGLIKTKRKRKKQTVKIVYEKIFVKKL